MNGERCETCKYWVVLPDDQQFDNPLGLVATLGACHRGLRHVTNSGEHETDVGWCWSWPTHDHTDFCGEWKAKEPERPAILDEPISALLLSVRTGNALKQHWIEEGVWELRTVRDLVGTTAKELRSGYRGFAESCLANVRTALAAHGLKLSGD